MMKRSLGRVRNGLIGLVALGLYSCGDGPIVPPVDTTNPTQVMAEVSPISGVSLVNVTARYECEDDNGISEYRIISGGQTTTSSSSIDALITFTESGSVKLECEDPSGNVTSYGPVNITVTQPPPKSLSQTTSLQDFEDILYSATSMNVSSATRETWYNGSLTNTQTIILPNSETLEESLEGDYRFILKADGVKPDTVRVTVPDYESTAPDLSGLNLDVNEGSSLVLHLTRADDKNTVDNPVLYTGVTSSGVVEASLGAFPNDTVLTIDAPQISGPDPVPYSIEISRQRSSEIITLEGRILDVAEPPTGDQIAYWAVPDTLSWDEGLFVASIGENGLVNPMRLSPSQARGQEIHPAWSPDGSRIAFTSTQTSPHFELYVMNADGSGVTRLTFLEDSYLYRPAWSPDGSRIATRYLDRVTNTLGIYVIGADGVGLTKIIEESRAGFIGVGVSWCSDNILVFDNPNVGNGDILAVNADGTFLANLTNDPRGEWDPDCSPDGTQIVFWSSDDTQVDIMNADGSSRTRLTHDLVGAVDARWSPNGEKIVYAGGCCWPSTMDLYVIGADGSGLRNITNTPASPERYPAWRPKQ